MHGATPERPSSGTPDLRAVAQSGHQDLMSQVARGDEHAFAELYDLLAERVYGLVLRVMRDPAQSEEVTQEVFVELWRTASRFQSERGSVTSWAMTIAHRRAVDRVRSSQSTIDREARMAASQRDTPFDSVADEVANRFEQHQVRNCLDTLTELQRESVGLAYYQGYTYGEVARLLDTPLGTIKTRLRDGLIRLRDCLGVSR
ncbi:ECF RNA polymerase sigma factor SigK [Haloechinothrix salitolerans]|uniref:ECF RNA polymerase sigma factor SigK n=1 Tax=Haloechinothrix salitolerans TaxID=926830 RepID=A0ABW2C4Z4_9PSEU